MDLYYIINKDKLFEVLSSLVICINDEIVYTEKPCINKEECLLKIQIAYLDHSQLVKVKPKVYRLNKLFNLENTKIYFLFIDELMMNKIKNTCNYIKEIKVNNEYMNKRFLVYNNEKTCDRYEQNLVKTIDAIDKKNKLNLRKLLILKGIVYGGFFNTSVVDRYILENYSNLYTEYKDINYMINEFNTNKKISREIYRSFIQTRKLLRKQIEVDLNKADYSNLLIEEVSEHSVVFNNNYLKLSDTELKLFENIIKYIFNNFLESNEYEIEKLVKYIVSISTKYNIVNDAQKLKNRVINEDYSVNVQDIKSSIIKNLYAVCIKNDNNKEFIEFLIEKNIDKSYLAYIFNGAIKGIMFLGKSIIPNFQNGVLKQSINMIEKNLGMNKKELLKLKLHYYIHDIYDYMGKEFERNGEFVFHSNINLNSISIELIRDKVKIEIFYRPKKSKYSKNIKYFEEKNFRLKKLKLNYKNDDIYFYYHYIIENKIKPINSRYEYIFGNILESICNGDVG
ncbi:MAG: hypothetical protein E7214_03980 [Clostridium sp.]|nr:hypothetical protein [Clostridium sp.]